MASCFYGEQKALIFNRLNCVIRVCIYMICHAVFVVWCNLTFVQGKYECMLTFSLEFVSREVSKLIAC